MQDYTELRNKREAQVARSNKHHPLNQRGRTASAHIDRPREIRLERLREPVRPSALRVGVRGATATDTAGVVGDIVGVDGGDAVDESEPGVELPPMDDGGERTDVDSAVVEGRERPDESGERVDRGVAEQPDRGPGPVGGHPSTELSLAAGQC